MGREGWEWRGMEGACLCDLLGWLCVCHCAAWLCALIMSPSSCPESPPIWHPSTPLPLQQPTAELKRFIVSSPACFPRTAHSFTHSFSHWAGLRLTMSFCIPVSRQGCCYPNLWCQVCLTVWNWVMSSTVTCGRLLFPPRLLSAVCLRGCELRRVSKSSKLISKNMSFCDDMSEVPADVRTSENH